MEQQQQFNYYSQSSPTADSAYYSNMYRFNQPLDSTPLTYFNSSSYPSSSSSYPYQSSQPSYDYYSPQQQYQTFSYQPHTYQQQSYQSTSMNESYVDSGYVSRSSISSPLQKSLPIESTSNETAESVPAASTSSSASSDSQEKKKKGQKRATILKLQHYSQYSIDGTICKLCGVDYNSVSKLLMHMHRYHKQRDALECPLCCKYFLLYIFVSV